MVVGDSRQMSDKESPLMGASGRPRMKIDVSVVLPITFRRVMREKVGVALALVGSTFSLYSRSMSIAV